ncbi:hypothetical protein R6Q59_022508 [Mikania micrantha]
MASKMMFRLCGSSLRTLISSHLRPTVAATNIQTETLLNNIYNWHYLLPNSFVLQPVNRFAVNEYSVLEDVARGRQKFEAAKTSIDDDKNDYIVSDLDDDDDIYGSGDDDFGTDDD